MRFMYNNTTTSSSSSTTTTIVVLCLSLHLLVPVLFQQYGSSISIKHGGSSSNSFAVEATNHQHQHQHRQLLRTRILEEDEDEDEGNDNDNDNDNEDEEEDGDGDRDNASEEEEENDASNYFGYDTTTGYLLATQCRAYIVEEPDDNVEKILEWNTDYGNGLDFFRVPQQSFVYYSYINGNHQDQSTSSDITHYMIDLTDWIATTAISGLGKDSVPSCQQINDVTGIFHTNDSDDITHYLAITDNNNDDNDEDNADRRLEEDEEEEDDGEDEDGDDNAMDFGDWEPQLYVGPICGMTDGTINIGVFLDDTCTTYVPQWTYRYRNALAQGKIKATTTTSTTDSSSSSSDSDSSSSGSYTNTDLATLGTLDKYTTKQNHHHWKCNSGDGVLCSSLLSYSADTMYCQSSDNESNDNDNDNNEEQEEEQEEEEEEEEEQDDQRRKLEEEDNEDGDDGDDDEDNENENEGDSNDNNDNTNYQISQEELAAIDTTCEAVFISFVYQGQGTLEDYLKTNKQLSKTTNYQKQNKMIVELVVLIMVTFVVFTMTILCVKQRKRRRNDKMQDNDSKMRRRLFGRNSRRTSRKSSASSTTTTNNNEDVATVGENSIKTYNTSNSRSSNKGRNKKQGSRWFSGFRRSKKQTKSSSTHNTRKEKKRNTAMTEKERNLLGSF